MSLSFSMEIILDQDKLRGDHESGLGVLVTLKQAQTLTVLGRCACVPATQNIPQLESISLPSPDWASTIEEANSHFPGGCGVCEGVWMCLEPATIVRDIWTTLITKTHLLEVLSPTVFVVLRTDGREVECFHVSPEGALSNGPVKLSTPSLKTHLTESTILCRLCTSTYLYLSKGQPVSSASIEGLLTDSSTVFCVPSKPPLVFSESTPVETTVKRLLKIRSQSPTITLSHSSQHMAHTQSLPVTIQLVIDHSQLTSSPSLSLSPPLSSGCLKVGLSVDFLVLANLDSPLSELAVICREKMTKHLKSLSKRITWKEGSVCTVRTHHLALLNHHCPVTIVYPHMAHSWEDPDNPLLVSIEELRPYREGLHKTLCVGTDIPYFRVPRQSTKQDSLFLSSNAALSTGPQLLNPHLYLKHTVKTGSVATVKGDYLYYHYKQDGMDDDGWGCSYRSLQTLWSWFWLQGYTEQPPPTHKEIQKSVVATKQRESSLIGSKQWIGSIEVGSSLSQLLGLEHKIKDTVRDMSTVGRLLLEHFKTQGTPVMIGGGVLAHTILGVAFNDLTGETHFLVLDPHYTGRDDMKMITDKGKWCGWKPISFWDENATYNLCMPFRPLGIV